MPLFQEWMKVVSSLEIMQRVDLRLVFPKPTDGLGWQPLDPTTGARPPPCPASFRRRSAE
jgi:hypothetical protein